MRFLLLKGIWILGHVENIAIPFALEIVVYYPDRGTLGVKFE